jgi:hypothetical protein
MEFATKKRYKISFLGGPTTPTYSRRRARIKIDIHLFCYIPET